MKKEKIIFFGNGPLAEAALSVFEKHFEVVFRAKDKVDLETVKKLKLSHPEIHGILASFGVMIKADLLEIFEPEGILNIHPSLLPLYRGASPIETAILDGNTEFGVSIMKLAAGMDAGPIYYQTTLADLPPVKSEIYQALAETGAKWIVKNLDNLPQPTPQDDSKATFTQKISKQMGEINPETETAEEILRKIIAFQGFPKVRYTFYGQKCIILEAHIVDKGDAATITIPCADGRFVAIDRLQPEGRKAMDVKAFLNGYKK